VSQKGTFFFNHVHFFLFAQKETNQRKKAPEPSRKASSAKPNENFSLFWQNALGFTLPKKTEVRTISGLPPRR